MSQTFTLLGNSSVLTVNYHPAIDLNPQFNYCLGLTGFHTYNTIPNIEKNVNDCFIYGTQTITIPEGSYEIEDIEKYLQKQIIIIEKKNKEDVEEILSIKPNNNTLKVEIRSIYDIDFSSSRTIAQLLGFSGKEILKANQLHESDLPVEIIKVISIRIECNIVTGAYYGDKLSHNLFEFSPSVEPGFSINIEPRNIIYLPVLSHHIKNITIKILDQDNRLVNFRGERILIRLELKKC